LGRTALRFAAGRDLVAFPAVFFFGMHKYLTLVAGMLSAFPRIA
jgi:hypothetical protein